MTSDTFRSHLVPPIDLVLHALQDALTGAAGLALNEHTAEECERLATLACALTRAINPGALASSWAAEGDADIAGAHLARRLSNPGGTPEDPRPTSNAEGRALETAVARRLVDTACSLAITGDKEDAEHARALWQASATLTGLLPPYPGDTLRAAADIVTAINGTAPSGFKVPTVGEVISDAMARLRCVMSYAATAVNGPNTTAPAPAKPTPRTLQSADEAPCGSLMQTTEGPFEGRCVMRLNGERGWNMGSIARGMPDDGWYWTQAYGSHGNACDFPARLIAEGLTESECRHLSGLSAADAIAWCEARDKATKPRPQPGDVVPWTEVEDGALYFDGNLFPFVAASHRRAMFLTGPDDHEDLAETLAGRFGCDPGFDPHHDADSSWNGTVTLIARDLGTDPEAWRKAMREWAANGNRPAAPYADEPSAEAATLELLRAALAVPGAEDIVAHARKLKAQADDLASQHETLWKILGEHPNTLIASARIIKSRAEELTAEIETSARRMALLLQADERLDAVRSVLGANDGESTVDAAKRVADNVARLKARDACETCREDRRKAIAERDAALCDADRYKTIREALRIPSGEGVVDVVTRNMNTLQSQAATAVEARAQMQARLVAVERERDVAQEEAKSLRVAVANKMSESMLAIMEGIAKGPTMEFRNGKP